MKNIRVRSLKVSKEVGDKLNDFSKETFRTISGSAEYLLNLGFQLVDKIVKQIPEIENQSKGGGDE